MSTAAKSNAVLIPRLEEDLFLLEVLIDMVGAASLVRVLSEFTACVPSWRMGRSKLRWRFLGVLFLVVAPQRTSQVSGDGRSSVVTVALHQLGDRGESAGW